MQLFTRIFDNNLCIAHFSLSYKEAMHIYQETKEDFDGDLSLTEEYLKDFIDEQYLNDELIARNLICVGKKEIKFLNKLIKDKPFMGIARFLVIPETVNLALPLSLPLRIKKEVQQEQEKAMSQFKIAMMDNNYVDLVETDTVDSDCVITYDLRFMIDGNVVSTYEDQLLAMYLETDFDTSRFLGAKVNDAVVVSEADGVITDFLIKKIEKKVPYDENTDRDTYHDLGFESYQDLVDRFTEAYCHQLKVNKYIDYCVDFVYENSNLEINQNVIDFYNRKEFLIYSDLLSKAESKALKEEILKKCYIFDLLLKMVELKNQKLTNDEIDDLENEYEDFLLSGQFYPYKFEIYTMKYQIYRYLKKEKVFE